MKRYGYIPALLLSLAPVIFANEYKGSIFTPEHERIVETARMNKPGNFTKLKDIFVKLPKDKLGKEVARLLALDINVGPQGRIIDKIPQILEKYGEAKINEAKNNLIPKYSGKNKILETIWKNVGNLTKSLYMDLDFKEGLKIRKCNYSLYVPELRIGNTAVGVNPIYDISKGTLKTAAHIRVGAFGVNLNDLSDLENVDIYGALKIPGSDISFNIGYGDNQPRFKFIVRIPI